MVQKPDILVVDDDELNLEMMNAYLEDTYQVSTTHSGEIAIERARKKPPHCILMDVRMSGMSGYDTTRILKEDTQTRATPILIVTGFRDDKSIQQAIDAGADDILFKPINGSLMLLRVKRMVLLKQLHDQLNG
jgi:adenylate cyclase